MRSVTSTNVLFWVNLTKAVNKALDILFAQVSTFLKDSTTFVYGLGAL